MYLWEETASYTKMANKVDRLPSYVVKLMPIWWTDEVHSKMRYFRWNLSQTSSCIQCTYAVLCELNWAALMINNSFTCCTTMKRIMYRMMHQPGSRILKDKRESKLANMSFTEHAEYQGWGIRVHPLWTLQKVCCHFAALFFSPVTAIQNYSWRLQNVPGRTKGSAWNTHITSDTTFRSPASEMKYSGSSNET